MIRAMVSFFDQFPTHEGEKVEIRGLDGYFCATDMSQVLDKRFTDWKKTKFAKRLLDRLSKNMDLPVNWEDSPSQSVTPLIDHKRGRGSKQWIHPAVAMSYAMSNPEFQADINVWLYQLMTMGTVNPNVMKWTQQEYERGLEMNRDDISDIEE